MAPIQTFKACTEFAHDVNEAINWYAEHANLTITSSAPIKCVAPVDATMITPARLIVFALAVLLFLFAFSVLFYERRNEMVDRERLEKLEKEGACLLSVRDSKNQANREEIV